MKGSAPLLRWTRSSSTAPAFGDAGTLKPQQIADVIAYVLSINNIKK
jgi:mono/diheme cytochrome c family protein